jgi:hypothetical protein
MAERGEPADDLTDAQLETAQRIALVTLAHEYAPEGRENQPPPGLVHVAATRREGPLAVPRDRRPALEGVGSRLRSRVQSAGMTPNERCRLSPWQ